jgi:CheY-like chemotaxis protein
MAQPVSTERNHHLHILLAEDNLVNQRLAFRLLEKKGHTVVVAHNGREALTILERERFDLALMDVQMPEIDGLEATLRIRQQERATGLHLPIIAMTAHAMKGDRERCLEVGMDGYISKPIQPAELFKVMAELIPTGAAALNSPMSKPPSAVFNQAVALEQVEGDEELLAELAELFRGDSARLLEEIKQAIAREESQGLERAAHTLKGAAGNFGAQGVVVAAERLEKMGQAGELVEAEAVCAGLEAEVGCLNAALGALRSPSLG